MTKKEIIKFQQKDRQSQLVSLIGEKIKEGYTLEDFKAEYHVSPLDEQDFLELMDKYHVR